MNQFSLQEHQVPTFKGKFSIPQLGNNHHSEEEVVIISTRFLKILGALFFFVVIFGGTAAYFKGKIDNIPETYEECTKLKGSRSQHSIPDVCITLDGNYFVQPIQDENGNSIFALLTPSQPRPTSVPSENPTSIPQTLPTAVPTQATQGNTLLTCKRSGCSGQVCVDISAEEVLTTCEYRPEYACYQEAPCERQPDGQCGFTPSAALTQCVQEKQASGRSVLQ